MIILPKFIDSFPFHNHEADPSIDSMAALFGREEIRCRSWCRLPHPLTTFPG
jgi:hypothetical protein